MPEKALKLQTKLEAYLSAINPQTLSENPHYDPSQLFQRSQ
jgi:hypothetical protein